jgi:hypothetical protein
MEVLRAGSLLAATLSMGLVAGVFAGVRGSRPQ